MDDALTTALLRSLRDGDGLTGLAGTLSDHLRAGIGIAGTNGALLLTVVYEGCTPEQKNLLLQLLSASRITEHRTGRRQRDALSAAKPGDDPFHMSVPLSHGGKDAGQLSALRFGAPFTEEDRALFTRAADFLGIQMAQDEKLAAIELRLKGNFIEDLVSGRFSDPESILARARALDYNITAPHRVLVATVENPQPSPSTADFRPDIVQSMQSRVNQAAGGMVIAGRNEFILLVRKKGAGKDIGDFKSLSEAIINDVSSAFKAKMFIGIGSVCNELSDFTISYMEAKKALEIGEYMITEGQVRSFEQFKVHALFLSTLKPADLYNYAREQLDPLLLYDKKHGTDFLKTLQEFLYLRNNVEGTAKAVSLSVSGLKYRLARIEKILGHDLKDYKLCFDLQLALVILQLFGEYRI